MLPEAALKFLENTKESVTIFTVHGMPNTATPSTYVAISDGPAFAPVAHHTPAWKWDFHNLA